MPLDDAYNLYLRSHTVILNPTALKLFIGFHASSKQSGWQLPKHTEIIVRQEWQNYLDVAKLNLPEFRDSTRKKVYFSLALLED